MNRHPGSLRAQLRLVHILASIALGTMLYSPWRTHPSFFIVMGSAVFPLLTLSGLWMWQGPSISRWLRPSKKADQLPHSEG